MVEATTTKPKVKPSTSASGGDAASVSGGEMPKFDTPRFEIPKFEVPRFEMPNFEVPGAFREIAEKGVTQAKDNWEKMKAASEEATDLLEESYASASKGAADYGLKLMEVARTNANANFDFAGQLITAKSFSEVIELSTAHMRKQFDAATAQGKELTALAQKVATDSTEPLKAGMSKAFKPPM